MEYEVKKFKLKGISPILGSVSLDKEIFTKFIASKAKTEEESVRALSDVENVVDLKGITGFYRDKDEKIILKGYQIKGFFKEACKVLKDQLKISSCVSKVDNFIFIEEAEIPLYRDGKRIEDNEGFLERPLRGETPQGPRVSLAKSEKVDSGWEIDITVKVIANKGTQKSVPMSMSVVEELLKYGELKGLLQWRNAGYGSFKTEVVKD